MPFFPYGILFALSLLLTCVFGAVHWVMACEEGLTWGVVAVVPGLALIFTVKFWRRRWVRRCFLGGALSFCGAIASFVGLIFEIPGLTQQIQAHRNGDYAAFAQGAQAELSSPPRARRDVPQIYDHFSDGEVYATLASEGAATARSRADWEQVADHWAYAADMMAAVSAEDERFAIAQTKLKQYKQNWTEVNQRHLRP